MQSLSIPKIPFDEIRFAITRLIADGDDINAASIKTEDEFAQSVERRKGWEEAVSGFLERSFSTRQYQMEFEQCDRPFFVPGGPSRPQQPIFNVSRPLSKNERADTMVTIQPCHLGTV
jgi:hypothetical protein